MQAYKLLIYPSHVYHLFLPSMVSVRSGFSGWVVTFLISVRGAGLRLDWLLQRCAAFLVDKHNDL
jgi:hypothetical protein